MKTLIIIVLLHVIVGIIAWIKVSPSKEKWVPMVFTPPPTEAKVDDVAPPVATTLPFPEASAPAPGRDPMAKWHSLSDGYTWTSATEEEKRALAKRLASASRHGNSENYFFDALEEFYSEPTVRKQKLDAICAMVEAASTTLPARMRRY